jgi:ribosomal protein L40E
VETTRCPRCGGPGTQTKEVGRLLCALCGFVFTASVDETTSYLECSRCGHRNQPQARECEKCGALLAKYCPRCGAKLDLTMRFCDQCGASHAGLSSPDGRCHWCGSQNTPDSEFCDRCGARLITVCPECESKMKAGLNYCGVCGLDFQGLIADQDGEED